MLPQSLSAAKEYKSSRTGASVKSHHEVGSHWGIGKVLPRIRAAMRVAEMRSMTGSLKVVACKSE